MKNLKRTLFLFATFTLLRTTAIAQCAMCKATASSDLDSGGSIATGLNTGIFYLMAIPYIILMIGGYFFFKEPIDAKLKEWKAKFIR
jgi:hypothetical protein